MSSNNDFEDNSCTYQSELAAMTDELLDDEKSLLRENAELLENDDFEESNKKLKKNKLRKAKYLESNEKETKKSKESEETKLESNNSTSLNQKDNNNDSNINNLENNNNKVNKTANDKKQNLSDKEETKLETIKETEEKVKNDIGEDQEIDNDSESKEEEEKANNDDEDEESSKVNKNNYHNLKDLENDLNTVIDCLPQVPFICNSTQGNEISKFLCWNLSGSVILRKNSDTNSSLSTIECFFSDITHKNKVLFNEYNTVYCGALNELGLVIITNEKSEILSSLSEADQDNINKPIFQKEDFNKIADDKSNMITIKFIPVNRYSVLKEWKLNLHDISIKSNNII